jgi:hypothetical protein
VAYVNENVIKEKMNEINQENFKSNHRYNRCIAASVNIKEKKAEKRNKRRLQREGNRK